MLTPNLGPCAKGHEEVTALIVPGGPETYGTESPGIHVVCVFLVGLDV